MSRSAAQTETNERPVADRLLDAAFRLFMDRNYHDVTTRMLANEAGTSTSMIQYYFGDKQTLYEEMMRAQFRAIGAVLEGSFSEDKGLDFEALLKGYQKIHQSHPDFPAFFTNILAYRNGPGYRLLSEILDQKRELIRKLVVSSQMYGYMREDLDTDVLRVLMMSVSVFPFLIRGVLKGSGTFDADSRFMEKVAQEAGKMLVMYSTRNHSDQNV